MNAAASKAKKFFTVEEANQRLPLVRAIVDDIVRLYSDVQDRRERLSRMRQISRPTQRDEDDLYSEEVDQIEEELEKDIERLKEFVAELDELGIELKDPFVGLIDFPAKMDDREVYLCWKLGEDDVAFWHELDAGFQGRQSLLESSVPQENPDGNEQDS